MGRREDTPKVEAPETPEVIEAPETPEIEEPAGAPDWDSYGWEDWDGSLDQFHDDHKGIVERISGHYTPQVTSLTEARKQAEESAEHHRSLWVTALQEDDPERFKELQGKIEAAELEAKRAEDQRKSWEDKYTAQNKEYNEFRAVEDDRYLAQLEAKWKDQLVQDRDENGAAGLEAVVLMNHELGLDPAEGMRIAFDMGLEYLEVVAELAENGLSLEKCVAQADRIYELNAKAAAPPKPEPVVVEEPIVEPPPPAKVKVSPAAALLDDQGAPPAPEPRPAGNRNSRMSQVAADLFAQLRGR